MNPMRIPLKWGFKFLEQKWTFYIVLRLLGCFFWWWFLMYGGQMPYLNIEWPITYQRFALTKLALVQGKIPFYAALFQHELQSGTFELKCGEYFLADVNLFLSPHLILLYWLSVPNFIFVHLLFLYTG